MQASTQTTPQELRTAARHVAAQLQQAGYKALWAGGCVRDMLMHRAPKDYDIATNATPDDVMRIFPRSIPVGKSFGVVRVSRQGHIFEVATFRKDFTYRDGRRPDFVVFADPETDALRRDFTVNAMFYDPITEELHDYVDGQKDLKAKLLRAVGDDPAKRFAEDHLRLLRAVRFAATLNFTIEADTARAIAKYAASITRISIERVQVELTRTFTEPSQPGGALVALAELGLLPHILPEVEALRGQEQPPQFHPEGDVFTHTVLMLNAMQKPSPRLAWAVLLHDIGKPPTCQRDGDRLRFNNHASIGADMTEKLLKRLRMANDDIKAITYCVANHMRFMEVQRMKRSTLLRLIGADTFDLELELHRLDCLASHGDLANYEFLIEFIRARAAEPILPDPLITGHDVIALGITAGPDIGHWKQLAYEAQLDGQFSDYDSGAKWLRQQLELAGV